MAQHTSRQNYASVHTTELLEFGQSFDPVQGCGGCSPSGHPRFLRLARRTLSFHRHAVSRGCSLSSAVRGEETTSLRTPLVLGDKRFPKVRLYLAGILSHVEAPDPQCEGFSELHYSSSRERFLRYSAFMLHYPLFQKVLALLGRNHLYTVVRRRKTLYGQVKFLPVVNNQDAKGCDHSHSGYNLFSVLFTRYDTGRCPSVLNGNNGEATNADDLAARLDPIAACGGGQRVDDKLPRPHTVVSRPLTTEMVDNLASKVAFHPPALVNRPICDVSLPLPNPNSTHNKSTGAVAIKQNKKKNHKKTPKQKPQDLLPEPDKKPADLCSICQIEVVDHHADRQPEGLFHPNQRLRWHCGHKTCAQCACSVMNDVAKGNGPTNKCGGLIGTIPCPYGDCKVQSRFKPTLFFAQLPGDEWKTLLPDGETPFFDEPDLDPPPPLLKKAAAALMIHEKEVYIRKPSYTWFWRLITRFFTSLVIATIILLGSAQFQQFTDFGHYLVDGIGLMIFCALMYILVVWFRSPARHPHDLNGIATYIPEGDMVSAGGWTRDAAMTDVGYHYKTKVSVYPQLADKVWPRFVGSSVTNNLVRNISYALQAELLDPASVFFEAIAHNDILNNTAIYMVQSLQNKAARNARFLTSNGQELGGIARF